MKDGKNICKQLKAIRREIAEQNNIPLEQEECTHKGNCQGTCPRCEQEVHYLEQELTKRNRLGKAVSIVGLATGLTMAPLMTSCVMGEEPTMGEPPVDENGYPYCPNDSTASDTTLTADTLSLDINE